jgi:hypothetical protein
MTRHEELKTKVLGSPAVAALSPSEFNALVERLGDLGDEAHLAESAAAFELMDYAFVGFLWAKGLL